VNFSGARDSFGIIFQKSRSNCEIRDCWLILEKPRGFFAKLLEIVDSGIIFARKKSWTTSGLGPRWTAVVPSPEMKQPGDNGKAVAIDGARWVLALA
jgi:hypothetical protein